MKIVIPEGTEVILSIDDYLPGDETRYDVEEVVMPNSVKDIAICAFQRCTNMKKVNISENVKMLRKGVFENCSSLEEVVIPDSVTKIGGTAFWRCKKLKSVKLPKDLTYIGPDAFEDCESLEEINIPDSVSTIQVAAFLNCKKLKEDRKSVV